MQCLRNERPSRLHTHPGLTATLLCLLFQTIAQAQTAHDIEFVSEHLAEAAMDNRYATLPAWSLYESRSDNTVDAQFAYQETAVSNLEVAGPMVGLSAQHDLNKKWNIGAIAFFDALSLSGNNDFRPLQARFAANVPIALPVDARFDHLDGGLQHIGIGLFGSRAGDNRVLRHYRAVFGLLYERLQLKNDRIDYQILAGPDRGALGEIDFDAVYPHFTPIAGLEWSLEQGAWSYSPHVLMAIPLPKRGVVGRITGSNFDIRGNQETSGFGAHFGDPTVAIGFVVTYLPARLSLDVGALLTQPFVEPLIHEGIDSNWVLSIQWRL